jgi:hypothetical protein
VQRLFDSPHVARESDAQLVRALADLQSLLFGTDPIDVASKLAVPSGAVDADDLRWSASTPLSVLSFTPQR